MPTKAPARPTRTVSPPMPRRGGPLPAAMPLQRGGKVGKACEEAVMRLSITTTTPAGSCDRSPRPGCPAQVVTL